MTDNPSSLAGGNQGNRSSLDFYATPPETTEALFRVESFEGDIWECACGDGAMSQVIEKYNKCYSSDIRNDNSIYGDGGIDFLLAGEEFITNNIITNPPYSLASAFVRQGLRLSTKKLALFLRLNFLEGQGRYSMFKNTPLKTVHVFCKRQTLHPPGIVVRTGGIIAYAWFVWDKEYSGRPYLDWIQ